MGTRPLHIVFTPKNCGKGSSLSLSTLFLVLIVLRRTQMSAVLVAYFFFLIKLKVVTVPSSSKHSPIESMIMTAMK